MNTGFIRLSLAAVAALCCFCPGRVSAVVDDGRSVGARGLAPKALLVMFDGLRADVTRYAHMPNLRSLMDGTWAEGYRGAWSLSGQTVDDALPSSGANHAAIATGVRASKTGVFKNGQTKAGKFERWPTWLVRVTEEKGVKSLFAYAWGEGDFLGRHPKVRFILDSDAGNAARLPKVLAASDAPDAVQYFINLPDDGGHTGGFYPFSPAYLCAAATSDRYLGDCLAAIKSRPTFAREDWLVLVTADHGGYDREHGYPGGQCSTVPVVIAGRAVRQGRIPGTPVHYDLTASALAHFGVDVARLGLDARPVGDVVAVPAVRLLSDGLAVYRDFNARTPVGFSLLGSKTICGARNGGVFGNCLHIEPSTNGCGGVRLDGTEKLKFTDGCLAATFWARLPAAQQGAPLLFGNRSGEAVADDGLALCAAGMTDGARKPGVVCRRGSAGGGLRTDIGTYDVEPGAWTFYAVVRDAESTLAVYQGRTDGRLYRIAAPDPGARLATERPFMIGQDGTADRPRTLNGDVDDLALWTRALQPDEVRRIFDCGRGGASLGDLLAQEQKREGEVSLRSSRTY